MKNILLVFHIVIAIALIALILLQSSSGGLGSAFGGVEFYRSKRGAERLVFIATIVTAIVFLTTSVLNLIVH